MWFRYRRVVDWPNILVTALVLILSLKQVDRVGSHGEMLNGSQLIECLLLFSRAGWEAEFLTVLL